MARRRQSTASTIAAAILVAIAYGVWKFMTWWDNFPPDLRPLLLIIAVLTSLSGVGVMAAVVVYRRRQKRLAWHRAMYAWQQSRRNVSSWQEGHQDIVTHQALSEFERGRPDRATSLQFRSVRGLTPAGLEEFAAQVFEQMGYEVKLVGRGGDHGVDVRATNPKGRLEIVQCKQHHKPVGEEVIRNLYGTLHHEKAVRAHLWAPGGFTAPARRWAKGKLIVLADEWEIGRIVEAAYQDA